MQVIEIEVALPSRDELFLRAEVDEAGVLRSAHLRAVGCPELLRLAQAWRANFVGALNDVPLPGGVTHSAMLLREIILKMQGRWEFPYQDEELCHCRSIATAKVDAAIVGGCHTVRAIRSATSANTSCGTCLPDVQAVLSYRLGSGGGQKSTE